MSRRYSSLRKNPVVFLPDLRILIDIEKLNRARAVTEIVDASSLLCLPRNPSTPHSSMSSRALRGLPTRVEGLARQPAGERIAEMRRSGRGVRLARIVHVFDLEGRPSASVRPTFPRRKHLVRWSLTIPVACMKA